MSKFVFWHYCYLALLSNSKVGVKVRVKFTGQGAEKSNKLESLSV